MASIANYCPDDVNVLVAGLLNIKGFVDGTFITIDKDVMPFKSVRTPDGTVARLYDNDQTYTIRITVHSGSNTNDFLTKLLLLDEITQRGKFPLLVKDLSGTDLFFSTTTWIEEVPSMVKSSGIDQRTWVLRSSQGVINYGNNEDPSGIIQDLVNIAAGALPILEGIL
jgi:hypothetical protein